MLTRDWLDEMVTVGSAAMARRQVIEWDKDDIESLKFMKLDVLGPGDARLPPTRLRAVAGSSRGVAQHL